MDGHDARLRAWERDGFFVVSGLFDPERVAALAEACDHVLAQVRANAKGAGHTTTHIAGLFAPDHFAGRPDLLARLVRFASSPEVVGLTHALGRPDEGPLTLRTAHYFHEPSARDQDGEWHRDGDEVQLPIDPASSRPPRATRLRFRIAFARDANLEIIPGSHLRQDTPEETRLRRGAARTSGNIPSAVRVALEAGDVCVFDTWTIHRGCYRRGIPRRTLDLVFGFGHAKSSVYTALREWRVAARW